MTDLYYRPAPGDAELVAGQVIEVPHQWVTFSPHIITVVQPPRPGMPMMLGRHRNGTPARVLILPPVPIPSDPEGRGASDHSAVNVMVTQDLRPSGQTGGEE